MKECEVRMQFFYRGLPIFTSVAIFLLFIFSTIPPTLLAATPIAAMDPAAYPAPAVGCLAPGKCHAGIEPIRAHDSRMAKEIYAQGNAG